MSRITQIDLCDYRAFPGPATTEIHLRRDTRHLLVYGENGSGKTSLARAIRDFFDTSLAAPRFADLRNAFTDSAFRGGLVKLYFADDSLGPLLWTKVAGRDGTHPLFRILCNASAWIDYERLRVIYQVDRATLLRDIFPLCSTVLLADVPMPARVERFGREWSAIQEEYRRPRGRGRVAANKFNKLQTRVTEYNNLSLPSFPSGRTRPTRFSRTSLSKPKYVWRSITRLQLHALLRVGYYCHRG
jgi:hypothetical protein